MNRLTKWMSAAAAAGAILATTATPASADPRVGGQIGERYQWWYGGADGFLGHPVTGEIRTPNGKGAYVLFQNGAIYWSPWTNAWALRGEIRNGWGRLGWENGWLGFPTGDERDTTSDRGRYQKFEGGTMYWAPWSGAHAVRGAIEDSYEGIYCSYECAWAEDILGFPVTSEIRTPNGRGAYNHFQWGSIYWSPATGAQPVFGGIRDAWASQGWENGWLGFPIAEEYFDYYFDAPVQDFEGGFIVWNHGYPEYYRW